MLAALSLLKSVLEAQARLRELEESVQKEEEPEARTPVPIVDGKPLSMKEILDRQGIEVLEIYSNRDL